MFRRGHLQAIQPGRQFRPVVAGLMVSTVRVLTIAPDAHGIPHVHFELTMESPSGRSIAHEIRVLALETFAALYPQQISV